VNVPAPVVSLEVAQEFARAGLVRSPRIFYAYCILSRLHVAPGEHLLTDDAGPQELARRLSRRGSASKAKVAVPEGWTLFDIAKRLETLAVTPQSEFVAAATDPALLAELAIAGDSAEGFLFPATYELAKDSDARDVVRRLVAEFTRRYSAFVARYPAVPGDLETRFGWKTREILTLASIVEKEAATDEERPLVASVFYNRLQGPAFASRRVLQSDPTAGYGCVKLRDQLPSCAGFSGKISHGVNSDARNPYSTYAHEGLPPGPIANPGLRAIEAVFQPAQTPYGYFVARGDGRHHAFSETLEQHTRAVRELRELRANAAR